MRILYFLAFIIPIVLLEPCQHQKSWTKTLALPPRTLTIENPPVGYDFEILWAESVSGNLELLANVCSNNTDEYYSLAFGFANTSSSSTISSTVGRV
jgi:hypothetical protein